MSPPNYYWLSKISSISMNYYMRAPLHNATYASYDASIEYYLNPFTWFWHWTYIDPLLIMVAFFKSKIWIICKNDFNFKFFFLSHLALGELISRGFRLGTRNFFWDPKHGRILSMDRPCPNESKNNYWQRDK